MTLNDGTVLVLRYLDAAAAHDLDAFDSLFATQYVNHRPDGDADHGPDGMNGFVSGRVGEGSRLELGGARSTWPRSCPGGCTGVSGVWRAASVIVSTAVAAERPGFRSSW